MQRYRVSCYDANNQRLAEITVEALDRAMAEMMVLTRLYGTDTRLVDHIDKLLVHPEGEEATDTELAIVHEDSTTANDAMGSNEPSNV